MNRRTSRGATPLNRGVFKTFNLVMAIVMILTGAAGLGAAFPLMRVDESFRPEDLQARLEPTPLPTSLLQLVPTAPPMPTAAPPPGARPIGPLDLGIQESAQGIVGSLPGQVSCDGPGVMRIDTPSGTLLAGITQDGGWSCQATLSQWRTIASQSSDVGVRYRPPEGGQPASVTLVNGAGRTLSMAVTGGWAPQ